jgi:type I restriction enzyme M protein
MNENGKSLESWIWDAACSIRGAKDAPKYKEYILSLIFTKRLCDVFDDELNRIAKEVGTRAKAFKLVKHDKKLVRFYLPLQPENPDEPVWSIVRKRADKIGEQLTTHLRAIADANPLLKGIIDRVDFNATTHGVRDLADDRLSNLIERISEKRLGLEDVEPDKRERGLSSPQASGLENPRSFSSTTWKAKSRSAMPSKIPNFAKPTACGHSTVW